MVIIGNAISRGNPEAEAALDRKLLYHSLPEVMKEYFLRGKRNFVVSGTHGKTTTSSMLAWLLRHAGRNPGFMIGGLPKNLGCGARFTDSEFNVLEGDEYDTAFFDKRSKFLHYLPECVVINNIEFDHADIYNSLDEIKLSFRRLLNIVPRNGMAFINGDDPNCLDVAKGAPCPVTTVGFGETCALRIENVSYETDRSSFTLGGVPYSRAHDRRVQRPQCRHGRRRRQLRRPDGRGNPRRAGRLRRRRPPPGTPRRGQWHQGDRRLRPPPDGDPPRGAKPAPALSRIRACGSCSSRAPTPPAAPCSRTNSPKPSPLADFAVVAAIPDLHKIPENDRLDPAKLSADIARLGGQGFYLPDVETIVANVKAHARPGDVIAVLSNGGFGGIHGKLLHALAQ